MKDKYFYKRRLIHTFDWVGGPMTYEEFRIYMRRRFWFPKYICSVYSVSAARTYCNDRNSLGV